MTARPRLFHTTALTLALTLGVACVPSSTTNNASRPPRSADSTAETAQEPASPPSAPVACAQPDVEPTPPPVTAPLPLPPARHAVARPVFVPHAAGPYQVRIVDASHRDLPTFAEEGPEGRTYVMGEVGQRYSIVVANPTAQRVEAVVSVDGLDAIDGHPANYVSKRGYILPAYGDATIDGFRTSFESVATFRFSSVADSYAGRLGRPRDVGVVGVAFFPEQAPVYRPAPGPVAVDPGVNDMYPSGAGGGAGPGPAAPAKRSGAATAMAPKRKGLGTEFGEARDSHVDSVTFVRANAATPSQVLAIRYNDRAGLLALGIRLPQAYASSETEVRLRESADPFRQNGFAQPPP